MTFSLNTIIWLPMRRFQDIGYSPIILCTFSDISVSNGCFIRCSEKKVVSEKLILSREQKVPMENTSSRRQWHQLVVVFCHISHSDYDDIFRVHYVDPYLIASYQFDQCGTTKSEDSEYIIFSNEIVFNDGHTIPLECRYPLKSYATLEFSPVQRDVLFYEIGYGVIQMTMLQFQSNKYMTSYPANSYPMTVGSNEEVFIQMNLHNLHNNVNISITECTAETSVTPGERAVYVLIQDE